MKISILIKTLQQAMQDKGDCEVVLEDNAVNELTEIAGVVYDNSDAFIICDDAQFDSRGVEKTTNVSES